MGTIEPVKYRVISTGKKIKAELINDNWYRDVKTGRMYVLDELELISPRKTMFTIGLRVKKIKIGLFFCDTLKYNIYLITPALSFERVVSYNTYYYLSIKWLFLEIGIRLVII